MGMEPKHTRAFNVSRWCGHRAGDAPGVQLRHTAPKNRHWAQAEPQSQLHSVVWLPRGPLDHSHVLHQWEVGLASQGQGKLKTTYPQEDHSPHNLSS